VLVERGILSGSGASDITTAHAADLLTRCCPPESAKGLYLRLEAAAGRVVRV
jgi:hypothetical protein